MKAHELGKKTVGQYDLLFGRLVGVCEGRAVISMLGLTVGPIEEFKVEGLPKLADTTKGITVAKLRCFLREAYRLEWISERPGHSSVRVTADVCGRGAEVVVPGGATIDGWSEQQLSQFL
jgi:hypothetical protein